MFAVYAKAGNPSDPLSNIVVGERPEPVVPEGWVRVKVTHASLNRHDIFTLMGITGQADPIQFPMILGNDGAGVLDDGTEVVIYPLMGSADWRGDETLDPKWNILSEISQGTMADYVAVPRRNAIVRPQGISALDASLLGTAWLTAYRALFTKADLRAGETVLVQGASGGMSTALVQLGRAAGFEVWVTSRSKQNREFAEKLGAHRTFGPGDALPRQVDAVIDNVGEATFQHSIASVKLGGTVVLNGITTGQFAKADLLDIFARQVTVKGTIMGTRAEMTDMLHFIITSGIRPAIGRVLPMQDAKTAFVAMAEGQAQGKFVLTLTAG